MDLIAGLANAILVICVRNLGARVASRVALTSTLIPLIVKFGVLARRPIRVVTTLIVRMSPMQLNMPLPREDVALWFKWIYYSMQSIFSQTAIDLLCLFHW